MSRASLSGAGSVESWAKQRQDGYASDIKSWSVRDAPGVLPTGRQHVLGSVRKHPFNN